MSRLDAGKAVVDIFDELFMGFDVLAPSTGVIIVLDELGFGERWQETHRETGRQIDPCQWEENLQIDVKDLAVGQDVVAVSLCCISAEWENVSIV